MSYEGHDLEALAELPRYQRWIVEQFAPYIGGDLVEIGAGTGNISQHLATRVRSSVLVEPSRNLHDRLALRVRDAANVRIVHDPVEVWLEKVGDARFDTIVMVNVLEHIEDDGEVLRRLRELVRPGGHLLVYVPALALLFSEMDARLGHYRRYSEGTLRSVVSRAGWEVVESRYADILGVVPWLVVNRLLGSTRFDPRMMAIYDRLFVPAGRFIESRVDPPIGKNLSLVARPV